MTDAPRPDESRHPDWNRVVKPSTDPVLTERLIKKFVVLIRTQRAVDAARARIHGEAL